MKFRPVLAAIAALAATVALAAPADASPGPKPKTHAARHAVAPAPTGGPSAAISLAVGAGLCLDDSSGHTAAGTKVDVWTCNGSASQSWTMGSDGTVRVHGVTGQCLGLGSAGAQLVACSDPSAQWFPAADKTLVSMTSIDPKHLQCLNDPRGSTAKGTQLIEFKCVYPAASFPNERFAAPGTTYASSALTYRPDSGGSGNAWALDTITRLSSVTSLGSGTYTGSVVDAGSFVTVPGNATPNQGTDHGKTLGDALTGTMAGTGGYSFTASNAVSAKPRGAVQGVGTTSTGNWLQAFFATGTTFGGSGLAGSGPEAWSWSYTSAPDNCGTTEAWTDAAPGGGQSATDGDITAPAPGAC